MNRGGQDVMTNLSRRMLLSCWLNIHYFRFTPSLLHEKSCLFDVRWQNEKVQHTRVRGWRCCLGAGLRWEWRDIWWTECRLSVKFVSCVGIKGNDIVLWIAVCRMLLVVFVSRITVLYMKITSYDDADIHYILYTVISSVVRYIVCCGTSKCLPFWWLKRLTYITIISL